jgi:Uma2 family endonuclease
MSTAARALVSEAEFLALPETTSPCELVDGELVMPPSPSYWHREVAARIFTALRHWASRHPEPVTVAQAPLDVRFGKDRILQPDIMVFLTTIPRDAPTPLDRIPDLCVEVLSGDRTYDRVTKRFLYAEAAVKEYWIVDPAGLIERRSGDGLVRAEEVTAQLATPLLPLFELDIESLFRA